MPTRVVKDLIVYYTRFPVVISANNIAVAGVCNVTKDTTVMGSRAKEPQIKLENGGTNKNWLL